MNKWLKWLLALELNPQRAFGQPTQHNADQPLGENFWYNYKDDGVGGCFDFTSEQFRTENMSV